MAIRAILVVIALRASAAQQLKGDVGAVYDLLDRVLPGARPHFDLGFVDSVDGSPFYKLADLNGGRLSVQGTSSNEIAAGIGTYFREHCNMTIGWPRGGGSNVFLPERWPLVGSKLVQRRAQPWSYMMNVCTHSYSLVWYSWQDWEVFIDWMALSGINLVLALTGQEEVQYKVFQKFGLSDLQIREWFNGPALLTWSRGQNEYGSDIAGPLPRSWMKDQWTLQRQILARYRGLGIVGQLPGFQGNVPIGLKALLKDANMTDNKRGTAWIDSLDPIFAEIADEWMKTLIADFGTDHWYQLDGYFDGSTAPWLAAPDLASSSVSRPAEAVGQVVPDPTWIRRGAAAYGGLNRTDPEAIWSFQGWAFVGWNTAQEASSLRGFVEAAPPGKFVVIDMSVNGEGEWKKWGNASFWGAPFIWTTLHDFGGTDGMKGDLGQINHIPSAGMGAEHPSSVWGTGFTPEGIDQNPVYYEFIIGANWRTAPVTNITAHTVARAHRRYALPQTVPEVAEAWGLLVDSAYAQDLNVQDKTGVAHLSGGSSQFEADRHTPTPTLCKIFRAWEQLVLAAAAPGLDPKLPPFRYDLVNLGRELLAQLTTPVSLNFTDAIGARSIDPALVRETGSAYVEVLEDIDTLVSTEPGFLLGSWLAMARGLGKGSSDCGDNNYGITRCDDFYEWNARVQLTTWNPTPKGAKDVPPGPLDYAAKHWSGLVRDYYARRVALVMQQVLADASASQPLDAAAVARIKAEHAYNWTTSTNPYPTSTQGDAVIVSKAILAKYRSRFATCAADASKKVEVLVV